MLLVAREVEVRAVVDPLELLPPERELVLDVEGGRRVVRELVGAVLVDAQLLVADAELPVPGAADFEPALEPLPILARLDEVLHLHLLELAGAEDEVPGRDLVAERLADLRDPERDLLARGAEHVLEVDVDPLRGLGPQIDDGRLVLDRPHEGLEHEVELPRLGEVARAAARAMRLLHLGQRVGAEAVLAVPAVDERIGEAGDVAGGLPDSRVHEDGGVETLDVVAPRPSTPTSSRLIARFISTPSGP